MPPEPILGPRGAERTETTQGKTGRFGFLCGLCAAVAMLLAGCGYHVAGRGGQLPGNLKTIAVPALENRTPRYRIEQQLTEALVRELLARTSYRVIADPAAADAVLRGQITAIDTSATVFDPATGRATAMLVAVHVRVRLEDHATRNTLYENDNFLFREYYELSTDTASFFDEQGPAMGRLARDFASRLVAAVLENF